MSQSCGEFGAGGGGSGYGSTRAYRDDPTFQEYQDDPAGRGYQDEGYTNFDEVSDQIGSNIFKINTGANNIDKAMRSIGTDRDSVQLRDKIHDISTNTQNTVTQTMRLFKRTAANRAVDKVKRMQLDRLKSQFQEALQRFTRLQKTAAEKVRSTVALGARDVKPKKTSDWLDDDDYTADHTRLVDDEQRRQELQTQDQVIEDDLGLIREREDRIRQLEADILDVNEIFRDLGAMIHEQGEVIDTIEANVETAYGNVEAGAEQLDKASTYQVIILGMTTNERLNVHRYAHFHGSKAGTHDSPFHRGYLKNLIDLFEWRCCGLCRPNKVNWSKEYQLEDHALSKVISGLDQFKRSQNFKHPDSDPSGSKERGQRSGHRHQHQHGPECKHGKNGDHSHEHGHNGEHSHHSSRENFQFV